MTKAEVLEDRIMKLTKAYAYEGIAGKTVLSYILKMYLYERNYIEINSDILNDISPASIINTLHNVMDEIGKLFTYNFYFYCDSTYEISLFICDEEWDNVK